MRIKHLVISLALLLLAVVVPSVAIGVPPPTTTPPDTTTPPPPGMSGDYVRINQTRELGSAVTSATRLAASDASGRVAHFYGGTLGMRRIRRESTIVGAPPTGFRYPTTMAAVSISDSRNLFERAILRALARGDVVMNADAASRRGVQVGDTVELIGWNRRVRVLRVGAISGVVGAELLMSKPVAEDLGIRRPSFLIVWGFADRTALDAALATRLAGKGAIRISRSWEPLTADDSLSSVQLKGLLGEFAIRGSGAISVDSTWRKANIVGVFFKIGNKRLIKTCHRMVAPLIQAAFDQITEEGLADEIDISNTQRAGGCYHPREVRAVGSTTGGAVSTHSWGGALDLNPSANCMGCRPKISCRVVQIFRSLGFAWGGNYLTVDGMHFEYVGERRDDVPSRPTDRCPTGVPAAQVARLGPFFADPTAAE